MIENENNDVSINHPIGDTKTSFLTPFPSNLNRCVEYVLREARLKNYYFGKYCQFSANSRAATAGDAVNQTRGQTSEGIFDG